MVYRLYKCLQGIFFCVPLMFSKIALAGCVLPGPDGGVKNVSNRNIAGYFGGIKGNLMVVSEYKTNRKISVDISFVDMAYSAFGGDERLRSLNSGVAVRIWYRHCVAPLRGNPSAGYIEFYSNNPGDQPKENYFYGDGQ